MGNSALGFHLTMLAVNITMLYLHFYRISRGDINELQEFFTSIMTGRRMLLTYLCHEMQTLYCLVSSLIGLYKLIKRPKMTTSPDHLDRFQDIFFFLCLVLSTMVVILYWSIFFVEVPVGYRWPVEFVHIIDNTYQHGIVALNMWIEMLFIRHHPSLMFYFDLIPVTTFGIGYLLWTLVKQILGRGYPYPFMYNLGISGHIYFNVLALTIMACVSYIFRRIMLWRWGYTLERKKNGLRRVCLSSLVPNDRKLPEMLAKE